MSVFEHNHRARIYNRGQHPLRHTLEDFDYTHSALPGVSTLSSAMDWIFTVLYPRAQAAVATPAALPASGNTIGDYRVVTDDGDGKAAGYQWQQREGDAAAGWYKISDMDWGVPNILAEFLLKTQDTYVYRYGYDDITSTGAVVTGTLAGQRIFGGASASTNLTLSANSGDGTGAQTGYVQTTDHFRPTTTNVFDLGTSSLKFRTGYFGTSVLTGTMTLSGGTIADTSGAISFGSLALSAGAVTVTSLVVGTTTLTSHTLADSGGSFGFGSVNLTTTGTLSAGATTATSFIVGTTTITSHTLADSGGSFGFGSVNLTTTGTLSSGATTVTSLIVGTTTITSHTLADSGGTFGFGSVNLSTTGTLAAGATTVTGTMGATTVTAGNLQLASNTFSSTNTNGDLNLSPNGSGLVTTSAKFVPTTDAARDLGTTSARFQSIYFSGSLGDGTTTIAQSVLQSLRDINVGVSTNYIILWNGTKWVSSASDSGIDHSTLSGLTTTDAGHTQFALLAGRSGGQTLQGDTAASGNLTFESTAHATKGKVLTKDTFAANTDASFSVTWSGTDLGGSSNRFRHIYTAGEHFGIRVENLASDATTASSAIGRLWWNTTSNYLGADNGTSVGRISLLRFQSDTSWDGATTSKNVTTSIVTDARTAHWQLLDNTNNFEVMYVKITATTASNINIATNVALPAGSYRLIGIQ